MDLIGYPTSDQSGSNSWSSGCTADESVGDAVYVLSAGQVRRAQADDQDKAEVVGFISDKPTATTCEVVSGGAVTVSGLTAGSAHFLSATTPGAVADEEPAVGNYRVPVGYAESTSRLIVEIDEPEYLTG